MRISRQSTSRRRSRSRQSTSKRRSRSRQSNSKRRSRSRQSTSKIRSRSNMSFFKRKSRTTPAIPPTPAPKSIEQIIDKETGLIPEGHLRDIILEYHFDNKKFIDKFIKEAVNGNEVIPTKDIPLLKKSIELMVEYVSSNKKQEIINILNNLRGKLNPQSIRILWQLQDELDKYW